MALLAFDVASSPQSVPPSLQPLLEPAHRVKTAQEVNEALLVSKHQGPTPALPGLLRMMAWSETLLEKKVSFPKLDMAELLGKASVEADTASASVKATAEEEASTSLAITEGDDSIMMGL